jgi:mono/diheme cytochrome c family protein
MKPQSNAWVMVKIALLILASTALYTHIGQLVPQKEVLAPTKIDVDKDATPEELAELGRGIASDKGLCLTCHTVGKTGALRYPDLAGIATRAGTQIEGMDALTYLSNSIYHPDDFIVDGFVKGMPAINKPPIGLDDEEMIMVLAYLQSLGGTPTVTLELTPADLGVE